MGSHQLRIGIEELQRQRLLPFTGSNRRPIEHEIQREVKEAVARYLHARSFPVSNANNFVKRMELREKNASTRNRERVPPDVRPHVTIPTPADRHMEQFNDLLRDNDMIFVSGNTGSGKSTRVPLALLKRAKDDFTPVNIVSFQPKKVCCISLADYCCTMRGEDVGDAVGYSVQDSKRVGHNLTFRPYGSGALIGSGLGKFEDYTHIILDEIHEQVEGLDLVLLWCKETMTPALKRKKRPKIVLMSATFHDLRDRIIRYFPDFSWAEINVGGGTFDVDTLTLTDIAMLASSKIARTETPAARRIAFERSQLREEGHNAPVLHQRFNSRTMVDLAMFHERVRPDQVMEALDIAYFRNHQSRLEDDDVIEFLFDAVHYCCRSEFRRGAVLVFVPLVADCERLATRFNASMPQNGPKAVPLHRHLPIEEQEEAVNPIPDPGVRVIFATAIAESSLTISNVAFVIDCAKGVTATYSCINRTYSYELGWVSKASRDQRKGRAGRMRPGVYIDFAPRHVYVEAPPLPTPAVLCHPVADLLLALAPRNGEPFYPLDRVGLLFNVPSLTAVCDGVTELIELGALRKCQPEGTYGLTQFGQTAARLGCGVRESKRMLMGVLFKTIRPILNYSTSQTANMLDRRTNSPNQRAERVLKMQNNMSDFAALNRYVNMFDDYTGVFPEFGQESYTRCGIGLHDFTTHVSNRQALDSSLIRALGDGGEEYMMTNSHIIANNKNWAIIKCTIASAMNGFAIIQNPSLVVSVGDMRDYNTVFGSGYGISENSLTSAFIASNWNINNTINNRLLWNNGECALFDNASISRNGEKLNGVTFISKNIAVMASGPLVEYEDFTEQCALLRAILDGADDPVITVDLGTFRLKATKSTICTAKIVRHLIAYHFAEFIRNGSLQYNGFETLLEQVFGLVARLEDQTNFGVDFEYTKHPRMCDLHPPQRAARGQIRNLQPEVENIPVVPRIPRPRLYNQRR